MAVDAVSTGIGEVIPQVLLCCLEGREWPVLVVLNVQLVAEPLLQEQVPLAGIGFLEKAIESGAQLTSRPDS